MLLTGQSGVGYMPLDWKHAVPTLAFRWCDRIIEPVVVPYLQQHNFGIFQHDNARPHTARHTKNILHIHNVTVLQWPARSPDLSPIEYLWDHIGHQVRECHDICNICRSLENWFAAWDIVVWQYWLRMVGTLGIEPCQNFYAWPPSSFHIRRRLKAAELWNNIDASH